MTKPFSDRHDAGRQLAARLAGFKDAQTVVLALVRGGLPVGFEVAKALGAALDIVLVRKLGAPHQPELAIGAIVDGDEPEIVTNADIVQMLGVRPEYIKEIAAQELAEIERRRRTYLGHRPRVALKGKDVIVVDDGIATGATIRAALRSIRRQQPRRLVLAVPVAPPSAIEALKDEVDDLVCLLAPDEFGAVGAFYRDFRQVDDAEVIDLLGRARWPTHDNTRPSMPGAPASDAQMRRPAVSR
jgi:putative phosphoribosyl transferase